MIDYQGYQKTTKAIKARAHTDETGGIFDCHWKCPYCGAHNNIQFFNTDSERMRAGDFEFDDECRECHLTAAIEVDEVGEL